MVPGSWFPLVLVAHITLAISLFLPSFLLPFTMRTRTRDGEPVQREHGRLVRLLLWLEQHGTLAIGGGVAITGVLLLSILGASFAQQPWLLAGLTIYAVVLMVSFFIQRPGLRTLLRIGSDATPQEQERWRVRARRQRYASYAMAAAIGVIGWLMMTKPGF